MMGATRRGRRRWRPAAVAGLAVLVVGAAAAAAAGLNWSANAADSSSSHLPPATATVTRQTLVDTKSVTGKLSYGAAATASVRSAGTVTALPDTGSVVSRGQALYTVDDKPVILLYGPLPAYRAMTVGDEGVDVEQLEQNLSALGYNGFTVDQQYTSGTASAVRKWQSDLGLEQTGTVELGRVVFATDQVRIETQEAKLGDAVQPGVGIVTYTGTTHVVVVDLDVADQRLAATGTAVQLGLPAGTTTAGTIARAQTVIQTGSSDPVTKIEVTINVADQTVFAGLDSASVRVAFTAQERKDVLTVPVAALLALSEGGYGVQLVEGSTTRIVAVQTGLFAQGRVEVSGGGLTEGMTVGVPS